ncbi:MAG: lantibiotic dehydratase family protein [Bacteroidales bacterium]
MRDNIPFTISPTFVVRTPLLPLNFLHDLLSDDSLIKEKLKDAVSQTIINEAIFIAAPEFHEQLQKWLNCPEMEAKEDMRIQQTLYKYLSRMSSRSTPFGLFAGCAIGHSNGNTKVELLNYREHKRHTRLDMLYLCNLAYYLSKHDAVRHSICYYPNTSIYESGEQLRYVEYRYNKDRRTHHLVQVKNSRYITSVLSNAKNGKSIHDLTLLLIQDGVPVEHAKGFVEKLIDNQILIGELDPTVTGDELLYRIRKIVEPVGCIDEIKNSLHHTSEMLGRIDRNMGNSPSQYHGIASELRLLNVDYNLKHLFQTDLVLATGESSVSNETLQSLEQGIIALNKLTISSYTSINIIQFKEAFVQRYDTREVELLKVLDTETGIGYLQNNDSKGDIAPLVDDIVLFVKANDSVKVELSSTQNLLLKKLLDAVTSKSFEIEITDNDLAQLDAKWDDLPATFPTLVRIVEEPSANFPAGRILMEGAGGNSATTLLGRFCHGSHEIHSWVSNIAEHEQKVYPNAIVAEIVHLPESRAGNVILRPVLRSYEIPFLTSPSVDSNYVISLDDLFISVKNNEIILRSRRLNKRVIPRLSNAHNYSANSVPVYQFLCDLQSQGLRTWIGFGWGKMANDIPFRPRVVYKNLIFSPASWIIRKDEMADFYKIQDDTVLLEAIKQWQKQRAILRNVLLEDDDNMLYVDFDNPLSVKTLLSSVKKRDHFTLREFLFKPDNAVVKCNNESFTNEFVFAFCKNVKQHS